MKPRVILLAAIFCLGLVSPAAAAEAKCRYQKIYVPFYSHIYYGDRQKTLNLAVTLTVRNVSEDSTINIRKVEYYDESGKLFKLMQDKPLQLGPMATKSYLINESEIDGGLSPSFVVEWEAPEKTDAPVVQAVQIGSKSNQGISIVTNGVVLAEE